VCQSAARLRCAKTAERIQFLLVLETSEVARNIVLDGSHRPSRGEGQGDGSVEMLPFVPHINTSVSTHSPDGDTFDAAIAKLL